MEHPIMVPIRSISTIRVPKIAPTEQQWNFHRERIQQLYIVQGKTLNETMRLMSQQHGLCATEKMWKLRLLKWQITKRKNLKDMRAVAYQMIEAGSNAGNLSFEVRGKAVTVEEVTRYFRRKGFETIKEAIQHTAPRSIFESRLYDPSTVPKTLCFSPFDKFEAPELAFKMIQVYYNGCFDTGKWYTTRAGRFTSRGSNFTTRSDLGLFAVSWRAALRFAKAKKHNKYRNALSQVCERIPIILRAEHPSTVRVFLEMLLEFSRAGLCHFAALILNHIENKGSLHHPLAIICRQLLRVEANMIVSVALAALGCGTDTLAQSFGTLHYSVICSRIALMKKSYSTSSDCGEVARISREILAGIVQSNHFTTLGYIKIAEKIVASLTIVGDFSEAEKIRKTLKPIYGDLPAERLIRWATRQSSCHENLELTIQNFCSSMEALAAYFGRKDNWVTACFNKFIFRLRLRGQHGEAEKLETWAANCLAVD